jgi:hypothetical protein
LEFPDPAIIPSMVEPARPKASAIVGPVGLALLTVLTQVVLRRELAPGEFGTLNALIGLALVLLVPLAALSAVLRRELTAAQRPSLHLHLLNRAALAWGIVCVVLLLAMLPALQLARTSLQFFTLITVAAGLLAICGRPATPARWCVLIGLGAAAARLVLSAWAGADWPVAESGLAALLLGALLAGLPALRDQPEPGPLAGAWKILRPALVPGLAAVSVALALALFTNADRIAAQINLGTTDPDNVANLQAGNISLAFVDYRLFDDYQAAGLCARGLLWALLPLLGLLYFQRTRLDRTTYASLRWFWIYLGALFAGALLLALGAPLVNALFHPVFADPSALDGDELTSHLAGLLPAFAGAFFVLGLVQAFAVFALASRRHVECFLLAGCSVAYTVCVFNAGRHAQVMLAVMSGAALMSLALVLLVGVVRYARSHP